MLAKDEFEYKFIIIKMTSRGFFVLWLFFCALSARGQTTFTGQATGTWISPVGGPNLVTSITNAASATLSHGETKLDLGNGEFLEAGTANVLTFTPASFQQQPESYWFTIGTLQSQNGTTFYDSEASQVSLHLDVSLTSPSKRFGVDLILLLTSTENSSDPRSSADLVTIKEPFRPTFTVGSERYILEFSWNGSDPSFGFVQGSNAATYEGATASFELRARFQKDDSYNAFDHWRIQKGLNGGAGQGIGSADDPDHDGLTNEEEFVFGGNPLKSDSALYRPVINQGAEMLLLTFQQSDDSQPLKKIYVEFSEDLATWSRVVVPQVQGLHMIDSTVSTFNENGSGSDQFLIALPRGSGTNFFARLKVGN
jgi:hypothetical protein